MLAVLIGEGKMHSVVLPKVPSGNYIVYDEYEDSDEDRQLLEIESKDGKWQITSDINAKIVNPNFINITKAEINATNPSELFVNRIILDKYKMCELIVGETEELYALCCLPVYENNWFQFDIRNTKEITIGKNTLNTISYENDLVSNSHARIFLNNGRWILENYDKKYGTFLNNNLVYDKVKFLSNGDTIFIMGLRIILMGNSIYINNPGGRVHYDDRILRPEQIREQKIREGRENDDKYIELYSAKDYFHRAPRISPKINKTNVRIEPPPMKKSDDNMPMILTMGSTLSMGVISIVSVISTFSGIASGTSTLGESILQIITSIAMLISILLIPILIQKWQKKRDKKWETKRQKKYSEYIEKKKIDIQKIKDEQRKILFENYATTEECTQIILNKEKRLWERTIEDSDFLSVNLGVGDIPLDINISYPEKEEFSMEEEDNLKTMLEDFTKEVKTLKDAPVTLSLTKQKIIAYIDKEEENVDKFMQNLFIQLMAFQSYDELKLVFLLKKDNLKKWEYVKMFPYVWNDSKDFRFFEDDIKHMEELSKYLEDEFNKRASEHDDTSPNNDPSKNSPYYLIITDDYRKIENLKIITNIFEQKGNLGFSIFCIAKDITELPNECKTFISIENNSGKIFTSDLSKENEIHFKFNNLNTFFFERIIKNISNIPIKYKLTERNSLPTHYSFLEMYNVGLVEQLNILDRWRNNDSTLSLSAPIGVKSTGKLINLDIHEKFHGPHGLIAGSTGSGKSEFIITYILSLAVNYHPDDVTFIIIDYKGGGLSGAFQKQDIKLPHLVGSITNIDKEGLKRSLVSIQSELRRRQILFNEAREMIDSGVIDIYKYQKLYHTGVLKKPISHLLIICDEFAELKQQQPDFMDELISVSRIGRSLGVHLILATQKPSGIVDEQIRSNSKFSICLKVQDKSDSTDVIEVPDAAYLKQSGRFYIKVGNGDYFDLGQSGWSGAQYYPADVTKKQEDDSIKFISNTGTIVKEINDYTKKNVSSRGDQLTNIVTEMYNLAEKENISAQKLWLDDIPEKIYIKQVKNKYNFKKKDHNVVITIGEYDEPENQKQGVLNLDLIKTGNTIVYGSADSGKETLLSTMIYDLMTTYTTDEVWMYIIDFGTESFKIFKECPHVGEVIFATDGEKLSRFFTKINEITKERKKILSEYNGDYGFFLRTSGKTMPLITIFINGYESFAENYGAIFEDLLLVLTREGQKLGITFIIATASSNDMRYRMKQNFKQKLALSLNDSGDYSIIFDGIGNRVPAHRFGRGFANIREKVLEFQTAKVCEPEEYNVFIKDEIEKVKKRNEKTAERIEILPEVVKIEDFKVENIDIANMPIGLTRKDIKPEFYNFKENFITIITAKNIEETIQFSSNIWQEMDEIKDVNTIILDPDRKVLSGRNDLKNNFEQLLANLKKKTTKHNICFILGLDKFINYLEDEANRNGDDSEGGEVLESVIKKCEAQKNVSFIIVDTAVKIKEHKYDDWYSEFVLDDNVIWIGNGIDDQYILEVNAPRREISNNCGCSFGYFNKKDKTVMLKLLGMKEKREEEDE